jgi:hypothetical protein
MQSKKSTRIRLNKKPASKRVLSTPSPTLSNESRAALEQFRAVAATMPLAPPMEAKGRRALTGRARYSSEAMALIAETMRARSTAFTDNAADEAAIQGHVDFANAWEPVAEELYAAARRLQDQVLLGRANIWPQVRLARRSITALAATDAKMKAVDDRLAKIIGAAPHAPKVPKPSPAAAPTPPGPPPRQNT